MTLAVALKQVDGDGNFTGLARRELRVAPSPDVRVFFGRIDSDPNPFLLDRETVLKLTVGVLGEP